MILLLGFWHKLTLNSEPWKYLLLHIPVRFTFIYTERISNPSRNSGTSCSNADSGVASQEEDEIESSSKDLEASDVDNKKEKQPNDNQYQIIDTNNEPMTSKETKR